MGQRRILKNQRRVGEAIMIVSGIGVGILGVALGVQSISFGGLCVIGLGIFSIFWR
jgi:hypothetical protein